MPNAYWACRAWPSKFWCRLRGSVAHRRDDRCMASRSPIAAPHNIEHVRKIARKKLADIFHDDRQSLCRVLVVEARKMRHHDDVFHGPKCVCGRQWFLAKHIQRSAGDLLAFESIDERAFVHHSAARQINEVRRSFHRGEYS